MSLKNYFSKLISQVEASDDITDAGKDDNGFYKPTRTVLLRNLNLLKDLHDKPLAKAHVKSAWEAVVKLLPAEWLILNQQEKEQLKAILED